MDNAKVKRRSANGMTHPNSTRPIPSGGKPRLGNKDGANAKGRKNSPKPQKGCTDPSTVSKSQPMIGSYPHNRTYSTSMNRATSKHTQQTPHYRLFTPTIHLKSYHQIQYWWKLNSTKPTTGTTSNLSCPNLNTHGKTSPTQVKWRQHYLHKTNDTSDKQ